MRNLYLSLIEAVFKNKALASQQTVVIIFAVGGVHLPFSKSARPSLRVMLNSRLISSKKLVRVSTELRLNFDKHFSEVELRKNFQVALAVAAANVRVFYLPTFPEAQLSIILAFVNAELLGCSYTKS